MNARRGLRRHSFATYVIGYRDREYLIRRHGRKFLVGRKGTQLIPGFFTMEFKLLRDARAFAEEMISS